VRNVEMLNETVLECVKDLRGVARHETVILDDDVRRQGVRTGRHRPYVEVVDVENVRNFAEVTSNVGQDQTVGRRLEQDSTRLSQQSPCA